VKKLNRKEELLKIVDNSVFEPLIDKIVYLEGQLEELQKLPMIKVNPNNPSQQKTTPSAKLYKEFLQQYTNCIKIISRASGDEGDDEESPLRKWVRYRDVD
jgi:hypothetical protein